MDTGTLTVRWACTEWVILLMVWDTEWDILLMAWDMAWAWDMEVMEWEACTAWDIPMEWDTVWDMVVMDIILRRSSLLITEIVLLMEAAARGAALPIIQVITVVQLQVQVRALLAEYHR